MIRCLIVDDEPLAQDVIETFIQRIGFLALVGKCENVIDALNVMKSQKIDLIFCDIQMPQISGIDFVRSLQNNHLIIFTTAYPEYALEGFNVDAVDFLVKPISFDRFLRSVNKVQTLLKASMPPSPPRNEEIDHMFLKEGYKLVKVNHADIQYLEGMKDYVKVFTTQKMVITHSTMKRMEELLPSEFFFRVHKSFIVRLPAIKSIYGNTIELSNGPQIPIGLQFRDQLLARLNNIK